jgi:putative ABC transport system ATP-binding protein
MTGKSAIEVKGIIKDFSSGDTTIRVLHEINMKVPFGKLTMMVGPSGCGKTTLLSIMTGILTPTEGEVYICDTNITQLSDNEKVLFRRRRIGFIFQQYNLITTLTAAENAAIPLLADDMPMEEALEKSRKILCEIGMEKSLDKIPSHLSGGQQQRVAIARALVHDPDILVCDEPTAALDAHTGHVIMEIMRKDALNPHRAVVVVTHDPRIFEFADQILHMNDGRIEKEEFKQGSAS